MNVVKNDSLAVMGSRVGTAVALREELRAKLGAPSYDEPSSDDKVTIGWVFATPRGPVELRDYWWNRPDEWSIAAPNVRAGMWLCRHLRRLGIKATTRARRAT